MPVVRAPDVVIEVREPGRAARRIPMSGAPIRIGRGAGVRARAPGFARLAAACPAAARDGVLVLTDLGSTNGTLVNGHRVSELALGAGDRIQIGETNLVVEAAPTGTGART